MKKRILPVLYILGSIFCIGSCTADIENLKTKYFWPQERPTVAQDMHGWFFNQHQLSQILNNKMTVIVELGSWLGKSTRFILEHAQNATVIAIDHWQGDTDITHQEDISKIPTLYETFLTNCWDYRSRLIPLKTTTLKGLEEINNYEIVPDLVYVDASHDYKSVTDDLEKIYLLFPYTLITGDDWESPTVSTAAKDFATRHGKKAYGDGNFYIII